MNTITFSRIAFEAYKQLVEAHSNLSHFVHKGALVAVERGEFLVKKFEPFFQDKSINEVTLKYDF